MFVFVDSQYNCLRGVYFHEYHLPSHLFVNQFFPQKFGIVVRTAERPKKSLCFCSANLGKITNFNDKYNEYFGEQENWPFDEFDLILHLVHGS